MAEELDLEIEVQRHPFARALEMIRDGSADMITGVAYTKKRNAFILFVPTPYGTVGPIFYTQKGRGYQVQNYADLAGLKIGYSINSAYFEPFNSDKTLHKIGISTEEQLIRMVALNRLDVTIGTNPNLPYDVNRLNLKDKVEQCHYVPEQQINLYIGLSRKKHDKMLQGRIDAFIRQMLESGEIQKIMTTYR